jgi:acyl-CoA synthetase (AMP-forming)/AMP-acid ligase II
MSCDDDSKIPVDSLRSLVEERARSAGASLFLATARDERQLTFGELAERVALCRQVLRSSDIRVGSRVGLAIADSIDFAVTFVAVLANGSWAAPLDPTIVTTKLDQFKERSTNLHLDAVVSDHPAPPSSGLTWITVKNRDVTNAPTADSSDAPEKTGGIILSSSGTTGTPKVIALSESQLLHAARHVAAHNRLTADDRGFNPLPLWHINAEVVALLASLVAGASLVLDDRFHRSDFWSVIDRCGATWINAVPAIISRIAVVNEGESVPARLRFVRSASAPLSPALLTNFEEATGVVIVESYGMTEAASQICVNPLDGPRKSGSVGPPVGVELRVRLEDSRSPGDVAAQANANVGHVEIRGPSVITHYEASGYEDRFDVDGWLSTGDLGYLDDDGYLFLVGRSDDVINRGGEKIFPREIEDVVLAGSDVVAAAVIGVPDEVFGQVPVLYVQFTAPDEPFDLEVRVDELAATLSANFPRARRPVRVIVVESFPSHATGKIQKKSLGADGVVVLAERDLA